MENTAQAVKLYMIFSTVKETNSVPRKTQTSTRSAHGSAGERSGT
jgi:hypothetical protein